MIIRKLTNEEIYEALMIKKECYETDFINLVPLGSFNAEIEAKEVLAWVNEENSNDIRKIYGAFEDGEFLGFIGASFAEMDDSQNGVEINYLFLKAKWRGLGIGLKLIYTVIGEYRHYGSKEVIVYSLHNSESNKFYRSFNPVVMNVVQQNFSGIINDVDVFKWDLMDLYVGIAKKLASRSFAKGGLAIEEPIDDEVTMTSIHSEEDYNKVCKGLIDYNVINTDGLLRKPRVDIELYLKVGDEVIGAILCDTYNYSFYIDVLWIRDDYRKNGYGKKLMEKAEEIAKANGCLFAHTTTFNFQSPGFYQNCGYEIFASLDEYPNGIVQYFLKKRFR